MNNRASAKPEQKPPEDHDDGIADVEHNRSIDSHDDHHDEEEEKDDAED